MHKGVDHFLREKYIMLKNKYKGNFCKIYWFMHKVVFIWLFATPKEKL